MARSASKPRKELPAKPVGKKAKRKRQQEVALAISSKRSVKQRNPSRKDDVTKAMRRKKSQGRNLQFPPSSSLGMNHMPWMQKAQTKKPKQSSSRTASSPRRSGRLPTDDVPSRLLDLMDHELDAFASYVRLDESECRVRDSLIVDLQGVVERLWAEASVQTFGSYATPAVCCFASDVDVAVWGLDAPEIPVRSRKTAPPPPPDPKREKIEKWKDLLKTAEEAGEIKEVSPDDTSVEGTEDDDGEASDEDNFEVHMATGPEVAIVVAPKEAARPAVEAPAPPQAPRLCRRTKNWIGDVLARLANRLRKSSKIRSVLLLKNARVPIVKAMSTYGVEIDIAVGGHNGMDTRRYAASQVDRYHSFAPVVLFLKVLLEQHDLDKPFTGGLGSYKLYVLVSYHLQHHLEMGGSDRPSEVLMSLLFRYGCVRGHNVAHACRKSLSVNTVLHCDSGGEADLSNVFKVEQIVQLMHRCWERLWSRVQKYRSSDASSIPSFLSTIINPTRLQSDRVRR